jgi:hypothetical protein
MTVRVMTDQGVDLDEFDPFNTGFLHEKRLTKGNKDGV